MIVEQTSPESRSRLKTTFRALNHRNYRFWFVGQGLSLIGTWMQSMAQQVLVYRLTGSASALGIVSFMAILPLVPFGLWGGSLSDRVSKRKLLLVTQTLMLVQSIVLGVLTWTGTVQIWHVYVMAFLLGTFKAVDMPARQSFVVEMVNGKEDLTSAIGLNSAIHNSAKTLGPALAGVIVAMLGEATAFFLNGLSFLAVIICLLLMTNLPASFAKQEPAPVLTHTVQGVKYVLGQQTLLILMSLIAVSSFLSRPYQTLMPVFSNTMLKESAGPLVGFLCNGTRFTLFDCQVPEAIPLGLLLSAVGLGAIMGAFLIASLPENAPRGKLLTVGNLSFPLLLILFVYSHSMAFSLFLLILVGLSHVFQNAMANTLLQLSSPDQLRGRVMSLYALVSHGMHHLGGLQAGFVADWIGAPISIGIGAGFSLLYGLFIAVRYRQVRNLM